MQALWYIPSNLKLLQTKSAVPSVTILKCGELVHSSCQAVRTGEHLEGSGSSLGSFQEGCKATYHLICTVSRRRRQVPNHPGVTKAYWYCRRQRRHCQELFAHTCRQQPIGHIRGRLRKIHYSDGCLSWRGRADCDERSCKIFPKLKGNTGIDLPIDRNWTQRLCNAWKQLSANLNTARARN
jgi:hypothetical protein